MRSRDALRLVCRPPLVSRSLLVALVVGTVLNAINQGAEIASGNAPIWWRLALTYMVPFLVASFGAWSALRQQ